MTGTLKTPDNLYRIIEKQSPAGGEVTMTRTITLPHWLMP